MPTDLRLITPDLALPDAALHKEATAVIAHTLAQPGSSVRVLEKAGFAHDGDVLDEEDGPLWRCRITSPTSQRAQRTPR